MSKENYHAPEEELHEENPETGISDVQDIEQADVESMKDLANEELNQINDLKDKLAASEAALEKEKKEYLFLMADFDNFRKRTLKEKSDIIKNGAESALKGLLPVIDDFERSLQAIDQATDVEAVKEGVTLIYNKFVKYLEQNGVKPIESAPGTDFDTEEHEAVTTFPAPDESQKGKVIDTVQKGYKLHDKVMRHAKVVVGQ